MSKAEILQELPNLGPEERREIFERICELEEHYLLKGGAQTAEEKALLDRELKEYQSESRRRVELGRSQSTAPDKAVSWRIVIRPTAETDLREARLWYESQRPGLGDELLEEVHQAVLLLASHPERHPNYYRNFRRIITRKFPYKIFYRIEGESVIVFRILHAKRDHRRQL